MWIKGEQLDIHSHQIWNYKIYSTHIVQVLFNTFYKNLIISLYVWIDIKFVKTNF